jgi:hypothetical protein
MINEENAIREIWIGVYEITHGDELDSLETLVGLAYFLGKLACLAEFCEHKESRNLATKLSFLVWHATDEIKLDKYRQVLIT